MAKKKTAVLVLKERRKDVRKKPTAEIVQSAKNVSVIEARYQVITLRRDGYSIEDIASQLNMSKAAVSSHIKAVMKETINVTTETTEEARQIQDMRLDSLVKAHIVPATESHKVVVSMGRGQNKVVEMPPSPAHAQIVLQIEQRRSKLLGLDKPEEKHLKITGIREYIGVDLDKV